MDRRTFLHRSALGILGGGSLAAAGCRNTQSAYVAKPNDKQMVGSHTAGGETYKPLVEESVARLLDRHARYPIVAVGYQGGETLMQPRRVCFVGVENRSAEEIGDFRAQLEMLIESKIAGSGMYESINRRFVQAGLNEMRMRPDQLIVPNNMRQFMGVMERQGQPFDYFLYAVLTSGTTTSNKDYQREYALSLEMLDLRNGRSETETATLTKGYNRSMAAKIKNFGK